MLGIAGHLARRSRTPHGGPYLGALVVCVAALLAFPGSVSGSALAPPFRGHPAAGVHRTLAGCGAHARIGTSATFNLSSGLINFSGTAVGRTCSGAPTNDASLVARFGVQGLGFVARANHAASITLTWNLSWTGRLATVNTSFCDWCSADFQIAATALLNDTTNGTSFAQWGVWSGYAIHLGVINSNIHNGTQTLTLLQSGWPVQLFFYAHVVAGHHYRIWTEVQFGLYAYAGGGTRTRGLASATVSLAGSRLASVTGI